MNEDDPNDIVIDSNFSPHSKSPNFYKEEHKHYGMGMKYIVGLAFGVDPKEVSLEEAKFALKMTKLLINFTEKERKELAECILMIVNAKEKTQYLSRQGLLLHSKILTISTCPGLIQLPKISQCQHPKRQLMEITFIPV